MKRIFFIVFIGVCSLATEAQNRVEYSKKEHDFGTIEELGGDVVCEFIVKNISPSPIVISKVHNSCSCVTTNYSRKPIYSQETDTLRVKFDPRFRSGSLHKNITMYISGDSIPTVLTIKGIVVK
ncbi:MAG: DUF1573 domain-containing protein [Rikenellaceae bacterium]